MTQPHDTPEGPKERRENEDKEWWEHLLDGTDPAPIERSAAERFTDADDHFVPPEPPPIPYIAPPTVVSALGLLAGLIILIWPSLSPLGYEMTLLIALILIVAGAVGLIMRLRNPDPETPEDPDEGIRF